MDNVLYRWHPGSDTSYKERTSRTVCFLLKNQAVKVNSLLYRPQDNPLRRDTESLHYDICIETMNAVKKLKYAMYCIDRGEFGGGCMRKHQTEMARSLAIIKKNIGIITYNPSGVRNEEYASRNSIGFTAYDSSGLIIPILNPDHQQAVTLDNPNVPPTPEFIRAERALVRLDRELQEYSRRANAALVHHIRDD